MRYFETRFLEDADRFVASLDPKTIKKVLYNIDLAEQTNGPEAFQETSKRHLGVQNQVWRIANKATRLLGQNGQQRNTGYCNTRFR